MIEPSALYAKVITDTRLSGLCSYNLVINKDAANGYVTLTNSFGHVGFFKATDEKTNYLPAGSETINNYE